jgi:hypothetical protein
MDPKAKNSSNDDQIQNNLPASGPISSGHPEAAPIQEVERPVSDYTSYPAAPTSAPVIQSTPSVKISDDIASQPSLKSVKGNLIDLKATKEKFDKGDIKESGTWEAGVQVYDTGKQKKAD